MVYGCGNNTVKLLMFAFNGLLALAGLAVMVTSIFAALNATKLVEMLKNNHVDISEVPMLQDPAKYSASFWAIAVVGGAIFLVGFLGCSGACCESNCLLGLFFTIILIIFVVQLVATVLAIVLKNQFKEGLKNGLIKAQEKAKVGSKFLRPFEEREKCCGINGATVHHSCTDFLPPDAPGCFDIMWSYLTNLGVVVIVLSAVILTLEALTMLFACILFRAFRERQGYHTY